MPEEPSLEGWVPEIGDGLSLAEVIDQAFEYRGDVTIDRTDGSHVVGYLANRDARVAEPFVELFETSSGAKLTLKYSDIQNVRFTGQDAAAGKSWEAWQRRREANASSVRERE